MDIFNDKETFKKAFIEKLETMQGKPIGEASDMEKYKTLGIMIREYISKNWIASNNTYFERGAKQVYYFSMEFLLGRLLGSNLMNLGLWDICREGLAELGITLDRLEEQEPDAGLGNGGLGRLAACFLDSLASLEFPGHGCSIRYKYGLFDQKIINGYQVELPEQWLREGNVWEIRRSDSAVKVKFGGEIKVVRINGDLTFQHENYETVLGIPYDIPVIGYHNKTVNTLRLWSAESNTQDYQCLAYFTRGYPDILDYKNSIESISEFLYPDDTTREGKVLRLKQQYFFVSAGIQSIVRSYKKKRGSLAEFHYKVAIHINDTHPVLAIAELMRILLDEEGIGWDQAWHITINTISYTNHTTLVEALETWPVDILQPLLPRVYMIIEEINERFCKALWNKFPGDWEKIKNMAIIADGQVKMAHLAIAGSHSVNGVSKIHSEILKKRLMNNYYNIYPYKFNNKTNGISHRRWLLQANPALAELISSTITSSWIKRPIGLIHFLKYAKDPGVQEELARIKKQNKLSLAKLIKEKNGVVVDVDSIFDVQVKRLHLYKRQLLNVLYIMDLYNQIQSDPDLDIVPRTFIFGAKAAPGYYLSKAVIKLINTVAHVINQDKRIRDRLKVVFLENYNVSLAEKIFPAADLSIQISTASKEASGTGNMKFMMNGAITLGTLDGANIEIVEAVGPENAYIFGLTAEEVLNFYEKGGYCALDIYQNNQRLQLVLGQLINGFFPTGENEFKNIYHFLLTNNDEFFVLKDFIPFAEAQQRVDQAYRNKTKWQEMSITNIAHSGKFSSDRTILNYATDIWGINPIKI